MRIGWAVAPPESPSNLNENWKKHVELPSHTAQCCHASCPSDTTGPIFRTVEPPAPSLLTGLVHPMVCRFHDESLKADKGERMTRLTRQGLCLTLLILAAPAIAQYAPVDPMPLGQTATSTMANKLSGDIADGTTGSNSVSSRCLADSGPGPERRAMEAEYARQLETRGKASADAWREEHGRRYRAKLVAAGKCK